MSDSSSQFSPLKHSQTFSKQIDFEYKYDDEQEGRFAEERAALAPPKLNVQTLPTRAYLDAVVTPHILEAMKVLAKERPNNPLEFFAYYLITHNPQTNKKEGDNTNPGSMML